MLRINFNRVSLLTVLTVGILAVYVSQESNRDTPGSKRDKLKPTRPIASVSSQSHKPLASGTAKHSQMRTASSRHYLPFNTGSFNGTAPMQPFNPAEDQRSAAELVASIEILAAQQLSHEEIRNHPEFDLLVSRLQNDPTARQQVLQQFLNNSVGSLGRTLSQALGMSGIGTDSPELKTAAVHLLREGSTEQRLNALLLLGSNVGDDPTARATVLEMLNKDAHADPQLALSALASLNKQGVTSLADHQAVLDTVQPYTKSPDAQVRHTSLQMLAMWSESDPLALQTFTEATNDADSNIRSFAVSALGQGKYAYEQVRDTLLTVLQNPNEESDVKVAALQVMQGYPLDEQALQIYQAQVANTNFQAPVTQVGFN